MCDTEAQAPRSFLELQKEAALAQARERAIEHRRVADIVLGERPQRGRSVGEIVNLGSDYLVRVCGGGRDTWTTVVGGVREMWHFHTQEEAMLHLIARRHGEGERAVYYAGRVLGIPCSDEA